MTTWLTPEHNEPSDAAVFIDPIADRQLRVLDLVLAIPALVFSALPLVLLLLIGKLKATPTLGAQGAPFSRWSLEWPDTGWCRKLNTTPFTGWPVLWNIVRGDMAWVGPRPLRVGAVDPAGHAPVRVRPGLVNSWLLRQRTAVDFGSEWDSDLQYLAQRGVRHDLGILARVLATSWIATPTDAAAERIGLGDVVFDNVTMKQAVDRVSGMLDGTTSHQVSFVNAACINIASQDRGYRRILARASMVLPDGIGVKIGADLMRTPLKQNVNGTDMFPRLCEMLQARGASIFLLGGQPGVVEQVEALVRQQWPQLKIAGVRDGFFSVAQEGEVATQIKTSGADLLFVARGVPMQDIFIDRHLHQLGVKVAMGVGGLFDFVSGRINRAPVWMRDTGLEWVYRFMQEPARMWKRYMLGNFTFLLRMVLQRMGLRQAATDTVPLRVLQKTVVSGVHADVRTVLFATTTAHSKVPVPEDFPSALLPLGWNTFIERALEQLSDAGIRAVDLVVHARPEDFRRILGDGERWGIQINWHMVKESSTPYRVLASLGLQSASRVLVGHADTWIAPAALKALVAAPHALMVNTDEGVTWARWASAEPGALAEISAHFDDAAFGTVVCATPAQVQVLEPGHYAVAGTGAELLNAQDLVLGSASLTHVPATWLRTPWGAHSPEALVQEGVNIEGPVLVGPGCVVSTGATLGAGTVLTQNVVVLSGAVIQHALVMPNTLVSGEVDLEDAIVNAGWVQNVRLDIRTVLPASDGLLMDIHRKPSVHTPWLSRLVAVLICLVALPWLALDSLYRKLAGLPMRWRARLVATGRDAASGEVRLSTLRCATTAAASRPGRVLAHYGAWLDVAQGRRVWFGPRPRSLSEWYALGRDWQIILNDVPVGCIHAHAWSGDRAESLESQAAADVFFAVNQGVAERLRMCRALVFGARD